MWQHETALFSVGDVVWVRREEFPLAPYEDAHWVRGVVERAPYSPMSYYLVRLADRAHSLLRRLANDLRPYDAVSALADLTECPACRDFGHDDCAQHHVFWTSSAVVASSTTLTLTIDCPVMATTTFSASTAGACQSEFDEDDGPRPRRKLTPRERARRSARRKLRKASRKRNR